MKTLEYNSKRLAKRIQALMKESSNVIVSPNTSKNVPKMQEIDEQEAYKQEVHKHPVLLTRQVIDFLKVRYDFRYNLLTEETEFRPSGATRNSFLPHRQARTEYFLPGSPQRRNQLLGQGPSKIHLLYPSGKLPPFPALYERTTCLGRNGSVEALGEASIRHSYMDKKLSHLDARTCRPMAGSESNTSKQRSPDTYQRRTGTP